MHYTPRSVFGAHHKTQDTPCKVVLGEWSFFYQQCILNKQMIYDIQYNTEA